MSKDFLSQDEVDALLRGVSSAPRRDIFKGLPRKWKVGSYTFKVEVVPHDHPQLNHENDGLTVFQEEVIYLNESMKPMRAAIVALHEAIHTINWVFGVRDGCEEETVTTQVSTGLMSFWQDNQKVMQWINKVRKLNG